MEFFELVTVLAIFLGMPAVIFHGVAKLKASKQVGGGSEIRRSELEAMIRDAVDEATADTTRRLQALEAIVTDDDPAPHDWAETRLDPAALSDALEFDEDDEAPAAVRRRARE